MFGRDSSVQSAFEHVVRHAAWSVFRGVSPASKDRAGVGGSSGSHGCLGGTARTPIFIGPQQKLAARGVVVIQCSAMWIVALLLLLQNANQVPPPQSLPLGGTYRLNGRSAVDKDNGARKLSEAVSQRSKPEDH